MIADEKNDNQNSAEIEVPQPSYWPIITALALLLIVIGVVFTYVVSALGVLVLLTAIAGWTNENRRQENETS